MYGIKSINRRSIGTSAVLLASLLLTAACASGLAAPVDSSNQNLPAAQELTQRTGVTSAFGIPAGIEGNVASGDTRYTASCSGCHGSSMGARDFPALTTALSTVKAMASLNLTEQELADITAYLNRASIPPVVNPPTDPNPPGPPADPPLPTTDPAPPSGDSLSGFGIPTGMSGSISAGEQVWASNCTGCHSSMSPKTFTRLESAISSIGAMQSIKLTQQQLADLTAYLNRGSGSGGTVGGGSGDDDGDDDGLDDDEGDDDSSVGDDDGAGDDDSVGDDDGEGDDSDDDGGEDEDEQEGGEDD